MTKLMEMSSIKTHLISKTAKVQMIKPMEGVE
jgi:hypothetical protein